MRTTFRNRLQHAQAVVPAMRERQRQMLLKFGPVITELHGKQLPDGRVLDIHFDDHDPKKLFCQAGKPSDWVERQLLVAVVPELELCHLRYGSGACQLALSVPMALNMIAAWAVREGYQLPEEDAKGHYVSCDNCTWAGSSEDIKVPLDQVPNLLQRIEPGGVVPAGECPECGALCYPRVVPGTIRTPQKPSI